MTTVSSSSLLESSLLNTLGALAGLGPLFGSSVLPNFANPEALASAAQSNLDSLQQFPAQQVVALASLINEASTLYSAALPFITSPLSNSLLAAQNSPVLGTSPYDGTSVSSSNSSAVSATSESGATLRSYSVGVSQLATSQTDTGVALTSSNSSSMSNGTFQIQVVTQYGTASATTTNVSYTIYNTFTEQQGLQAAADALNAADLGLTATVSTSGGNSQLIVQSNTPGTQLAFQLSDVGGGKAIKTAFGSATVSPGDAVVTDAADSIYSVNGTSYSSAGLTTGNTVTLDGGKVTLTLSGTTSSDATVTVSAANTSLASEVTTLADAFNSFREFLSSNSSTLSSQIAASADSYVQRQAAALQAIGVTVGSDGTLSVNQTTLADAAQSEPFAVEAALSGSQGLATRLSELSSQIASSLAGQFTAAAPTGLNTEQLPTGLAGLYPSLLAASTMFSGGLVNLHA